MIKSLYILFLSTTILFSDIKYYQESNETITTLTEIVLIQKSPPNAIRWYKNSKKTILGLKNNFFLSLNEPELKNIILNDFDLIVIKEYKKNIFLVQSKQNDPNLLTLINNINTKIGKLIAHPNFYKKVIKR